MQILHKNISQGDVKCKVENADDLWYLQKIIATGDVVSGKTERKIKIGGERERSKRVSRKRVFLSIEVEKVEFHESSTVLRVNGKTVNEVEDVPKGSYHTFNVAPGTIITIHKEWWSELELQNLDEARKASGRKVLIVCHNREEAVFGVLTSRGVEELSSFEGDVAKKRVEGQRSGNFYEEIAQRIQEYDARLEPGSVVVASPSFWKEYVIPHLSDRVKEKTTQASCSSVERGLQEVVNRPELEHVLEEDRTRRERELIEQVREGIANDTACYGLSETENKVKIGAVETLVVAESKLQEDREGMTALMQDVEDMDGSVHIVSGEETQGELENLGGVAGVLRWQA